MEKSKLESLVSLGLSIRKISVHENTSYTNVRYWLRKFGLKTKDNNRKDVKRKAGQGAIIRGYVLLRSNNNSVYEHVSIAEKALGKPLPKGAEVHHVDGNRSNNNPWNLVVCPNRSYHMLLHRKQKALEECGNPNYLPCIFCSKYDSLDNLTSWKSSSSSMYHIKCKKEYYKKQYLSRCKHLLQK